jgi:hypothetical protein
MPDYTLSWLLPFVRLGLRRVRPNFTFTEFVSATWTELDRAHQPVQRARAYVQNNPDNPEFAHHNEPEELKQAAIEAWLYIQRRGFAMPVTRNFPSALEDRYLEFTKRGREWRDCDEPVPEMATEYIVALGKMVPQLDQVVREYVAEGLGALEHDRFRSAAIMIGAASEKALYLLAEKMLDSIATAGWKQKFTKAFTKRDLPELFDQMKKVLEAADKFPGRPFEVFDGGQEYLLVLIKATQVQRNNAVHPMNAKVTDDTVRLSYLAFPSMLQKVEQLRDWFSKNQNIL